MLIDGFEFCLSFFKEIADGFSLGLLLLTPCFCPIS